MGWNISFRAKSRLKYQRKIGQPLMSGKVMVLARRLWKKFTSDLFNLLELEGALQMCHVQDCSACSELAASQPEATVFVDVFLVMLKSANAK